MPGSLRCQSFGGIALRGFFIGSRVFAVDDDLF